MEEGMASRIPGGFGRSFDSYDVAVVGAGQAGLALGYFLARQGRNFVILEAALTWQYTRGSALLGWVAEDASYIADQIEAFRATAIASERQEPAHVR
jgi:2-polyprenyl-6-methoxyphenol hydroxylase-like FAD-dependent oxidoreductase